MVYQSKGDACFLKSIPLSDVKEKRGLLKQNSEFQRLALELSEPENADQSFVNTTEDYLESLRLELDLEWDASERLRITSEALRVAAGGARRKSVDEAHLARLNTYMADFAWKRTYLLKEQEDRDRAKKECLEYINSAVSLAASGADEALKSRANICAIFAIGFGSRSEEVFTRHLETALESSRITGDNRLIADALSARAIDLTWEILSEAVPERRAAKFKACKEVLAEAVRRYEVIMADSDVAYCNGRTLVLALYRMSFGVVDGAWRMEMRG